MWPAQRRARRTSSARLQMAMQSLDEENPPYSSAFHEFAGCESADEGSNGCMGNGPRRITGGLAAALAAVSEARCQGFLCAPVSIGGMSGPVVRRGVILGEGSLETDVQLP